MYFILIICIIKAQTIVFQDLEGDVYTITDEVRKQTSEVEIPGADVLALVDGDGDSCVPSLMVKEANNLRILVTSSPRSRADQRWLTRHVQNPNSIYVVGPWEWDELAMTLCVTSVLIYIGCLLSCS